MVGSTASLCICPSVCDWIEIHQTIEHILKTIADMVMKFGQYMHMDDPNVDLEGQGHRPKVRVPGKKSDFQVLFDYLTSSKLKVMLEVKGQIRQCPKSHWSRSNVTWVKVSQKVMILTSGFTSTSSCFILVFSWFFPISQCLHIVIVFCGFSIFLQRFLCNNTWILKKCGRMILVYWPSIELFYF